MVAFTRLSLLEVVPKITAGLRATLGGHTSHYGCAPLILDELNG